MYANNEEAIVEVLAQLEGLDDGVRQQALDEADDNQLTALHLAAYTDHQVAAAMLLAAGAPLETKVAGMGMTALHWAAAQGSSMVLAQLITAGTSSDIISTFGVFSLLL